MNQRIFSSLPWTTDKKGQIGQACKVMLGWLVHQKNQMKLKKTFDLFRCHHHKKEIFICGLECSSSFRLDWG